MDRKDAVSPENKVSLPGTRPPVRDFGPDQLRLVAFNSTTRKYGDRQMLYREGDKAHSALVVLSGEVAMSRKRDDQRIDDGRAGPGDMLGEMALLVAVERANDAHSVGASEILDVPRSVFHRVLEEYPDIARSLHARISERFGSFVGDLQRLKGQFAALEDEAGAS